MAFNSFADVSADWGAQKKLDEITYKRMELHKNKQTGTGLDSYDSDTSHENQVQFMEAN